MNQRRGWCFFDQTYYPSSYEGNWKVSYLLPASIISHELLCHLNMKVEFHTFYLLSD